MPLETYKHTTTPTHPKADQPAAHIKSKLYMSIMFSRKPAPQGQSPMMRVYQNCYTCRTNINMFAPQDARVHYAVPKQQPQPTPTNQITRPDRVVAGRTTKTNKPPPPSTPPNKEDTFKMMGPLIQDPTVCQTPTRYSQAPTRSNLARPQRVLPAY